MGEYFAPERMRRFYTRGLERSRLELVARAIHNQRNGFDPLSTKETERIARNAIQALTSIGLDRKPIGLPVADVDVSSSHVVRLYFNEAGIQRYLRGYAKECAPALLSVHEP